MRHIIELSSCTDLNCAPEEQAKLQRSHGSDDAFCEQQEAGLDDAVHHASPVDGDFLHLVDISFLELHHLTFEIFFGIRNKHNALPCGYVHVHV